MWFYYFSLFHGVLISLILNWSYKKSVKMTGLFVFYFVGKPYQENKCPTNIKETTVSLFGIMTYSMYIYIMTNLVKHRKSIVQW